MHSQDQDIGATSCAYSRPKVIPFVLARPKGGPPQIHCTGNWRPGNLEVGNRERSLDQFYTRDDVAEGLYAVLSQRFDPLCFRMIDPSAGAGAFFRLLPRGSIGFDVDPKMPGIRMDDFLEQDLGGFEPCIVVGNPPFGQASRLAVKFFNHAARWCQGIAMVLPRTFRKASVQNQLDESFHLVCEVAVPEDAFYFRERRHSVPTTFQIWERRPEPREKRRTDTQHPDFQFLPPDLAAQADVVVQRIGAQAGRVHRNRAANPNSHYFIKGDVEQAMRRIDFSGVAANVAGTPSLAKSEIVELYRADAASMASRNGTSRRDE